jgi:hypothetical protein
MFDVGPYTLAPFKVVWHRMVTPVEAAVAGGREGKPVLPQETHAFVPCESADEAAYLCGMMNSTIFNFAAHSYSQAGGKSFASPHILQHIRIPAFHPNAVEHLQVAKVATAIQRDFSQLSGEELSLREQQLDAVAAAVWQLKDEERNRFVNEHRRLTKADLA